MYNREYQQLSAKHGRGSVMVWGCISDSDVGMNYKDRKVASDIDPQRSTIWEVSKWQQLRSRDWSPQSPDLDTEAAWNHPDWKCNKRQPTSKIKRALDALQERWRTIPEDCLIKYKKSFIKAFTLCWRVKMIIPIINFCFCLIYCLSIHRHMIQYISLFPNSFFLIVPFLKRLKNNNKE